MKTLWREVDRCQFRIGDFASDGILAPIQAAGDRQSRRGGGAGDQTHDGFVVTSRFPPPVGGNKRKETRLDLVPFAGSRRKMAHVNRKRRLVGQTL